MVNILKSLKTKSAIDRLNEEALYELVIKEIKSGKKRDGLWGKALTKSNGDIKKAEAHYIQLRVQSLIDENQIIEAEIDKNKKENLKSKPQKNPKKNTANKIKKDENEVSGKQFFMFMAFFILAIFGIPMIFIVISVF